MTKTYEAYDVVYLNTTKTCYYKFIKGCRVYYSYNTPIMIENGNIIMEYPKRYSSTTSKQRSVYMCKDILKRKTAFDIEKVSRERFIRELQSLGIIEIGRI